METAPIKLAPEQPGTSGDAVGLQHRGDRQTDRLVCPGLVRHHEIGRERVEFTVGALHRGAKGLQVDGDVGAGHYDRLSASSAEEEDGFCSTIPMILS